MTARRAAARRARRRHRRARAGDGAPRGRRSSVPSRPGTATTPRTPRSCSRRWCAARRATSRRTSRASSSGRLGGVLERAEVAGPGFLNLFLADDWHVGAVDWMLEAGERFGAGAPERPERVNVEFVSANPTGPLTAASGRHAAYGDALARLLAFAGHEVEPRVLLQRRRLPGAAPGRVDPRPRARGAAARGRLPGRLRQRAGRRRSPTPPRRAPRCSATRAPGCSWTASGTRWRPIACTSTRGSSRPRCTRATPTRWRACSRASRSRATSTAATARCGCARRPSATTRTAWSSAPRAS